MTLSLLAAHPEGCGLSSHDEGLPLHCALKYGAATKVVLAIFEASRVLFLFLLLNALPSR